VSYVVRKPLDDHRRLRRTVRFLDSRAGYSSETAAATYFGAEREVFARLHADERA
jgi:hypothetical protein